MIENAQGDLTRGLLASDAAAGAGLGLRNQWGQQARDWRQWAPNSGEILDFIDSRTG